MQIALSYLRFRICLGSIVQCKVFQWTVVGIYGQHGLPVASRVDPVNKHAIENVQIRNRYLEGSRVQENPMNLKIVIFDFVVVCFYTLCFIHYMFAWPRNRNILFKLIYLCTLGFLLWLFLYNMISSISVSEPASTFLILCMYIFYNVNYIDRVWEVFVKCIKLKLHLASTVLSQ